MKRCKICDRYELASSCGKPTLVVPATSEVTKMHSMHIEVESTRYTILFNSDWSGDVTIVEHRHKDRREFKVPGRILLAVGEKAAKRNILNNIIRSIEDMY